MEVPQKTKNRVATRSDQAYLSKSEGECLSTDDPVSGLGTWGGSLLSVLSGLMWGCSNTVSLW